MGLLSECCLTARESLGAPQRARVCQRGGGVQSVVWAEFRTLALVRSLAAGAPVRRGAGKRGERASMRKKGRGRPPAARATARLRARDSARATLMTHASPGPVLARWCAPARAPWPPDRTAQQALAAEAEKLRNRRKRAGAILMHFDLESEEITPASSGA